MGNKPRFFLLILMLAICVGARGQNVAVKTNLPADVALSPNLGVEVTLAKHWSIDLSGQYNHWTIQQHKWKHWFVQPEARYWFCYPMARHFLALHAIGGQYNVGNIKNGISFLKTDFSPLGDNRFQGWAVGAGIAYGYAIVLGHHWNLELELGLGYAYAKYDKFAGADNGPQLGSGKVHYVGPTKAAINLVYVF